MTSKTEPIPETQLADPPWARAENESDPAHGAFLRYRDMGHERSLAKVARELGKSKQLMERWSRRWRWRQRVDAWQRDADVTLLLARNEEIRISSERQARQATTAITAMMLPHLALATRLREDPELVNLMATGSVDRLLSLAARTAGPIVSLMQAERLARGEPTEIRHTRTEGVSVELTTEITDDEYREIVRVLNEAGWLESEGRDPEDPPEDPAAIQPS